MNNDLTAAWDQIRRLKVDLDRVTQERDEALGRAADLEEEVQKLIGEKQELVHQSLTLKAQLAALQYSRQVMQEQYEAVLAGDRLDPLVRERGRELLTSAERPERLVPSTPPSQPVSALTRQVLIDDEETGQIHRVEPTPSNDIWLDAAKEPAVIRPRSAKVNAIREAAEEWRKALRDKVHVGGGKWIALGDCWADDLLFAAKESRDRARRSEEQAERYEKLADQIHVGRVSCVKDLPDDLLREHFGGSS